MRALTIILQKKSSSSEATTLRNLLFNFLYKIALRIKS